MTAAELLADDDFAGLVYQHWHVTVDERQPASRELFAPRTVGERELDQLLECESERFSVRPVCWHRLPCEVCGGAGRVDSFMNGRFNMHPCPRGCDKKISAAAARMPKVMMQFDLAPALVEGAIRDKLIALGWAPPQPTPTKGATDGQPPQPQPI